MLKVDGSFHLEGHRPHLRGNRFSTLSNRRYATSTTVFFRGCSHSLMFRLPYLLGHQVAPTAAALHPQGSQAVYTTQDSRRYRT